MSAFLAAVGFLTAVPVPSQANAGRLADARAFFPLVGLLLGAALAGLDAVLRLVLPLGLSSALLVAALLVATRGLHFDGFLDCCDALLGGNTRERRLEIMKDPHVGSFAVGGGAVLLLVTWSAIAALPAPARAPVLVLVPCLSRWAMLAAMAAFPYARPNGLGTAFSRGAARWQVAAGLATSMGAALALAGWAGLMLLGLATLVAWGAGRWMNSLLGGLTGDCYGAINEAAAACMFASAVAIGGRPVGIFSGPA